MIFPALLSISAVMQLVQLPHGYIPPVPAPSAVLAKVNGKWIRTNDVEGLLWDWAADEVIKDLELFQLIEDRAALDKVVVTPAEIKAGFEAQLGIVSTQVPKGQTIEDFIREKGYPKSRLYLHVQADLLLTKIVDLKFKPSDYVSVSALVVKPKSASAADIQDAAGKAQDLYTRLTKKGEDWDKVLASSDQIPAVVQSHGAMGWRTINLFPQPAITEFRTLKVHQYTKPVQMSSQLVIFRIDGFGTSADATALSSLKKQFEDNAKKDLITQLQKNAKIETFYGKAAK